MARPLQRLEPKLGQELERDGDLFRVIALTSATVLLLPEAGGDPQPYVLGSPAFAPFEVAE